MSLLLTGKAFCQSDNDVTTMFPYASTIKSDVTPCQAKLYSVRLTGSYTYVTIELTATKNADRLNYWTSEKTYVESGYARLPLLGAKKDDTYHSCTYSDGWGWDNVKKGGKYYYTLIFSGRIPEGNTNFSLIDPATSGRGFSFPNYTINNPKTHSIIDEGYCRENIDENNDGICGIYEEVGNTKYRLACIKSNGKYFLIYLGCSDRITWWFQGDLKASLEESATLGTFKATWIMRNKTKEDNTYVFFDGTTMKTLMPNGNPSESTYVKMYPTASSGAGIGRATDPVDSEWTGTGFALTNNYVVTNYHVVENANTIQIQGIDGNFNSKYNATVVATDKNNDLALLKVRGCTISSANIPYSVKSVTSDVGEDVFVLGYPLTSTMGDEIKLTTGVISSKTGFQGDVSQYQISAPIQPGNSGGPLFDSKGNVIGIVSAKHKGAENVGYAIKASYLRNLMESAVSDNILPQNNKISELSLSGKVKAVKNYVYYITCSTKENANNNSGNSYSNGSSYNSGRTFYNPSIATTAASTLKILSVTLEDNRTVIRLSCNNRGENGSYYAWVTLDPQTYIVANGQRYTLTKAEGIALTPNKTYYTYNGENKNFTLYFPAIPKSTTSIDLVENNESDWRFYGISLH